MLKGGMQIASLVGTTFRTTMDMDAILRARTLSPETIGTMLKEICVLELDDEVGFEFERAEKADEAMQARWQRYARMYSYARDIEFREIIDVLMMLLHPEKTITF